MKREKYVLSQHIVRDIITKIHSGEFPLNSKLPSELTLASTYKVGRSKIREALSVLKSLGILTSKQGGGHYIGEVDIQFLLENIEVDTDEYLEIKSLFELRYILDTEAAFLAAERRTEEDIVELRKALLEFEQSLRSPNDAGQDADYHFHRAMISATHNPFMIKVLDDLSEKYHKALSVTLKQNIGLNEKRHSVYKEHEDILKAIEEGKPELAKVYCKIHLDNVQKKLNFLYFFNQ
ncbi:FadR/GntR family transcriptional regulator [Bacillus sp. FJAT-29937]|uniref:FadR/GntR family transcriptional regulator n=1 Tax=Bacillus sp. FJAT-29937 TaxID=1720553 RepID=UPI000833CB75|nr:FadR/GntR family transcriptional regulator [Bacillus sp. FJAT-29937]